MWERPQGGKADRGIQVRGRRGHRGRGTRTRLSPESTSSREMRLWPSRRSSYRSLMCLWAWGDRGAGMATGPPEPKVGPGAAGIDPRGQEAGGPQNTCHPEEHLPLPSSATRRDEEEEVEEEKRDRSAWGRRGQKMTGFRDER